MHDDEGHSPTALFVGHPGHELRLLRWLEIRRPLVFVLTDGSGRSGAPRIESSREIAAETGCTAGSIFGRFTDRDVYDALLTGEVGALAATTLQLADELIARDVRALVADAFEFYNPTHDLCAVMATLAVRRARESAGRAIERCDFAVTEPAGEGAAIEVDEETVERKIAVARRFRDLSIDVDEILGCFGRGVLRREVIRALNLDDAFPTPPRKPFYEQRGEEQVAAGRYRTVLRYEQHFLPAIAKLAAEVGLALPEQHPAPA